MTDAPTRGLCWAILGTGDVSRKFARDLAGLQPRPRIAVVASRRGDNARRFAAEFGGEDATDDYAAAAARPEVEAVYIATPADLHEAHALMAIAAGKAVLVEKPMAPDAAAARRIAEAARQAGVFCMEAMWTRFQPLPGLVRDRIRAGDLGDLRGFDAQFMGASVPDPGSGRFDPARAGGALLHRGIYPLSIARFLLGPVTDVQAMARIGETGVDEDTVLVLRHADGAISTLRSSLRANGRPGSAVYGTKGTLALEGPIWRPTGARLHATRPAPAGPAGPRRFEALRESGAGQRLSRVVAGLREASGRGSRRLSAPFAGNGYRHEAEAVTAALAGGRTEDPRMPLAESIEILEIMDRARTLWSGKGGA